MQINYTLYTTIYTTRVLLGAGGRMVEIDAVRSCVLQQKRCCRRLFSLSINDTHLAFIFSLRSSSTTRQQHRVRGRVFFYLSLLLLLQFAFRVRLLPLVGKAIALFCLLCCALKIHCLLEIKLCKTASHCTTIVAQLPRRRGT